MTSLTVMETALSLLDKRNLTERGLREKLASKEYSENEIEDCIKRLLNWGYLNDVDFGVQRLDILKKRLKSRAFCLADLTNAGIPEPVVDEIIAKYYPEQLEITIANQLLSKKQQSHKSKSSGAQSLVRAGFSEATIYSCFPNLGA